MVRRTIAPILVWFCTFQRKMSPTLMCTRSRSDASSWLCVPLPLPCTPMITYLRMSSAWHTQWGIGILRRSGGIIGYGGFPVGGPPRPSRPLAAARPRPGPQRRRQVEVGGNAVRGRLVVHPPTAEVHPRLLRRPLERPARLGQVLDRLVEIGLGQHQ